MPVLGYDGQTSPRPAMVTWGLGGVGGNSNKGGVGLSRLGGLVLQRRKGVFLCSCGLITKRGSPSYLQRKSLKTFTPKFFISGSWGGGWRCEYV